MDNLFKKIENDWRKLLWLNALCKGLSFSLFFSTLALCCLSENDAWIIGITSLVVFVILFREKWQITTQTIVHQLNCQPEVEHSAELLLKPSDELPFLARLQRQKILEWLQNQGIKHVLTNERRKRVLHSSISVVISAIISMLVMLIAKNSSKQGEISQLPIQTTTLQHRLENIEVQIEPPAYTLKPKRIQTSLNLLVEEHATVRWKCRLNESAQSVRLVTALGDTIDFKRESEFIYWAETKAKQSQPYALFVDEAMVETGAMEVQKDLPPVISVLYPTTNTAFSSPDSAQLFIKVIISDDYKVRKANLVLTTAKGKGEAIKFKSDTLKLHATSRLENGIEQYQTVLDLKKNGLTYGDECYFFIEAFDNCEPRSNAMRSETYFAKILDTLQVATSEGILMPVLRLPTYLRSQRQIIIETEKLIAEKRHLEPSLFRVRSNNLGIDQKVLRLRYGRFLGEELTISIGETQNEQLAKAIRDSSTHPIVKLQKQALARTPKVDDLHNHEEQAQANQSVEKLIEPYMHRHDLEEAATFFSEPIKQKLKVTLSQMWEAEKFLRLAEPEYALPYEYKALQLLKELQQQARVYVEKSGFEPAPIDEASLRLTGENSKIQSTRSVKVPNQNDTLNIVKTALDVLNNKEGAWSNDELARLEEAGRYFAQHALEKDLKAISVLQVLRKLISDAKSGKACRKEHVRLIQRAFSEMLPVPYQLPRARSSSYSLLMKRYLQALNERQ